jgi:uncharacterized protein (TIGR03435 family)
MLMLMLHRPVTDRTGITEEYPIALLFARLNASCSDASSFPQLPQALEEQLGLTLQEAQTTVDILVIDHAALPVQN